MYTMNQLAPKLTLNELYEVYVKDPLGVDDFATELRDFITRIVKAECRRKLASSYDLLEDAIGESLLEVWREVPKFQPGKAQFSSYVTRIVLNNFVDIIRKYQKRKEIAFIDNMPSRPIFRSIEARLTLQGVLDRLDEADKSFVIRKVAGMSNEEIATADNTTIDAVKGRWKRLKKAISMTPFASADA